MKNIKKLILLIIILIILIIITLVSILSKNKETEYIEGESEPTIEQLSEQIKVKAVTDPTTYYTVVKCVNLYLQYCSTTKPIGFSIVDQEEAQMTEEKRMTRIYNILNTEYIKENNITTDNVRQFVNISENRLSLYPIKMNELQKSINEMISTYAVYGRLKDSATGEFIGYGYFTVLLDMANMTFSIKPHINNNFDSVGQIDLKTEITRVDKNDNNDFTFEVTTEDMLIKNYYNNYKMYFLTNPDIAYEYLDSEYKEKRFKNQKRFEAFSKENIELLGNIEQYQRISKDNYTQYICIDSNEKYIIINEFATMEYTVILDSYTIDTPEFLEKYNSATEQKKVGMNIERILEAINAKDYEYVYNKLDETFRKNNYKTLDEFKKYIENNFYSKNDIEYKGVTTKGKNHIYEIKLVDLQNTDSKQKDLSIIMQLKEGTDFVMSFNLK